MLDQKIIDIVGGRSRSGDYGLELEVEGMQLPRTGLGSYWVYHEDHSLRGESAEYVLANPLAINDCRTALNHLDGFFTKHGSVFNLSSRTSVHVHMNVQKALVQEVYNLIALELILDNLLVEYSGPDRIGNLFCLRAQDAEYLPLQIAMNLRNERYFGFLNDNIRYASMNLLALQNYGSVEFRSFRGCVNPDEIMKWIEILQCLKIGCKRYNDPRAIVQDLYNKGPLKFIQGLFPPEVVEVFTSFRNWRTSIEKGSHYAFEIAYATDAWKDKEEVHKSYKSRRKARPGDCEDPTTDPRLRDETPAVVEQFLRYEVERGEVIRHGTRDYTDYIQHARERVRQLEDIQRRQELEQEERIRQRQGEARAQRNPAVEIEIPPVNRIDFNNLYFDHLRQVDPPEARPRPVNPVQNWRDDLIIADDNEEGN